MPEKTARLPTDPVFVGSLDSCVYDLDEPDDGILGSVSVAEYHSRAAAQRYFAGELGINPANVQCRTTYGRILTRQDAWDEYGYERWEEDRIDELDLMCKHDPARGAGLAAFWYEDEQGREVPEAEYGPPREPPSDWEPNDEDPVWTVCEKDDPGAVKIYICEAREA